MQFQIFISQSSPDSKTYLWYEEKQPASGILINPGDQWESVKNFLQENQIELKWILLTEVDFHTSHAISEIQKQTGAQFLSFQSDLLKLRMLPRWADERNVCGIKIPQVSKFLDRAQTIDLEGCRVYIENINGTHHYQCGKLRVPEK